MERKFCKPCLDRGHECPAHVIVDGDGWCFSCRDERPCKFEKAKQGASPVTDKPTCTCGCGEEVSEEGKMRRGHWKRVKNSSAKPKPLAKKKVDETESAERPTGSLTFTEPQIDRVMLTMSFADKLRVVQNYLNEGA